MDLERVQKTAVKIITKEGLEQLKLPTLKQRREILTAKFATKCRLNKKTKEMYKRKHKETQHAIKNNKTVQRNTNKNKQTPKICNPTHAQDPK